MRLIAAVLAAALLAFSGVSAPSEAGSDGRPVDVFTLPEAADFSKAIERDLAAQGARVALVFRSGRPREDLPEGVRYTHGAFWVYTSIITDDGRTIYGYAVYNLYHDPYEVTRSDLIQDWPLDFARGDVVGEVGVIIPTPAMQRRLLDVIASPDYAALHNPNYSLLSDPASLRYQNCTEFMLDVVAAAAWQTNDRRQIKANIRAYFDPMPIESSPFERLFARFTDPRLRLDDHRGGIETATWGTLADFMEAYGLAEAVFELESPYAPGASQNGPGPSGG